MRETFVELGAASNFSFLHGASHPEELVVAAAASGYAGLAVCDRNTLAGVVRCHLAARDVGLKSAVGTRLSFADGTPDVLAWPTDRAAYGRLCRMLTVGNMRGGKGDCRLNMGDLEEWSAGLVLAPIAGSAGPEAIALLARRLCDHDIPLRLAMSPTYNGADARLLTAQAGFCQAFGLRPLATNLPLYHAPERRQLQDVLTAIREHTSVERAGRLLNANAERHIKSAAEMARLFHNVPDALGEGQRVLSQIGFSLDELRYEYPEEPTDPGRTPQETLVRLTWDGAAKRYPDALPIHVARALEHELALIENLDYAPYFITVYDVVRFARSRGILAQGRGSAANSAVCFCLGITEVDPVRGDLLFERFISPERREPPDIDVDFEHERREEVIQYIYEKYGRERAGIAATIITYRARSAAREVGKALGFSEDAVSALSGTIWGWSSQGVAAQDAARAGLSPHDSRIRHLVRLTHEIAGFPRHLSQHVGGFVITRGRLDELVPITRAAMDGRTNIEWDKDDIDALGILKIDVLALGMLTCLRKGLTLLAKHYASDFPNIVAADHAAPFSRAVPAGTMETPANASEPAPDYENDAPPPADGEGVPQYRRWPVTLATIPPEDPEVYDMICRADTLGVFQIESRAQMTMLPRLRPRTFYDLVIEVAIVRPGPIQGDMVHPYLRRRQGLEKVTYPSRELEAVLSKTLGVPLFQEQAMRIAIVGAGFTPSEADQLRRAMATFKKVGTIGTFQTKMVEGMKAKGYDPDFAERCFKQIEGFGEYGFPESHAASFALLVYASCWLKCHYPDVFCAALLNSQPMGFYAPAQIVRDARQHGVAVRPVDINHSDWDCTLEPGPPAATRLARDHLSMEKAIRSRRAVRLGLRQVKGLAETDMAVLVERRGRGYDSVRDVWLRTGLKRAAIERLADADAFGSLGLSRRDALWAAHGLDKAGRAEDLPLFAAAEWHDLQKEAAAVLPPMPPGEEVIHDYRFLSLSLKAHPASFVRDALRQRRVVPAEVLSRRGAAGRTLQVAGLVLVRQRPGSAKGVIFMTLEDETGIANAIIWPKVFEAHRQVVLGARFIKVTGRVQSQDGVVHIVASALEDCTPLLNEMVEGSAEIDVLDRADEVKRPSVDMRTVVKPRSKLARLATDVPELTDDVAALLAENRALAQGGAAPSAVWGTARSAAADLSNLGAPRQGQRGVRKALPKGRNFH
ncbi:DNA polymerase III subunit alpha [Acuticoccus sp. MNP-M23]|uniref:DNA polymerase III subunit alpha n=1 Tax=Acuticoccus sp. MNP-M23 TaxID=3072793 RepID=UPI0028154941|nr:DNA polymerase III subunit alpha [Acuticoccus sp. MNP-M23]WMS41615.1 DNA polymerase III subunit alpha [Acuticoccus sp. MNP-M23]